ncbi:hypothetical protein ABZ078_11390 [Streptomyces sp. NPDC006385]|uniref:hypothetical protein n=1 Tax=Streptomyces sp. NPDC006385 TaxID=3156761 RepID=UPI0033A092ED
MAVSLGMRISGLLVVGAVAVAAAAFTTDGDGTAGGRGGGDTVVIAGPSGGPRGLPTGAADRSAPPVRSSPNGQLSGLAPADTPSASPSGAASASPSALPAPSPSAGSTVVLQAPPWLPPGPDSPDTDGLPDPAVVYDRLRTPSHCRSALGVIPQGSADEEWRLLRALATACLAVQGGGGDWESVTADHSALAGRVDTCKGRAAYAVLGGLLDFHRRHPGTQVRLAATTGATPACGYRIAGVDTGGDGEVRPGDTITIELADTYLDHAELVRSASVNIGGLQVPGAPVLKSESGDRLVLSVVVPALEPGPADIAVHHAGTEVHLPAALTVTAPDVVQEPSTDTGTPGETASPLGASMSADGGSLSSLAAPMPAHGQSASAPTAPLPPDNEPASPLTTLTTSLPAFGEARSPLLTGPGPRQAPVTSPHKTPLPPHGHPRHR